MGRKSASRRNLVKLRTMHRLLIMRFLLPADGDMALFAIRKQLEDKLQFTEAEVERLNLRTDLAADQTTWNVAKDREVGIEFTAFEREMIAAKLKELNAAKKLKYEMVDLWSIFIGKGTGIAAE